MEQVINHLMRMNIVGRIAGEHRDTVYRSVGITLILAVVVDMLFVVYKASQNWIVYDQKTDIAFAILFLCMMATAWMILEDLLARPNVGVILDLFLKASGFCTFDSIGAFVLCARGSDLLNYVVTNAYWLVVLLLIGWTWLLHPFPRSAKDLVVSVLIFAALNQATLVINYILQFGTFYVDWLAYQAYEHPPITLGVIYAITGISVLYGVILGLASQFQVPLNYLAMIIGVPKLAFDILSWVAYGIFEEIPWIVFEVGFVIVVIVVIAVCANLPATQTRNVEQNQPTMDNWITFLARQNMPGMMTAPNSTRSVAAIPHSTTGANNAIEQRGSGTEVNSEMSLTRSENGILRREPVHSDSNSSQCCLCKHNPRSVITFPCRHVCMCDTCAKEKLDEHTGCPSCQGSIESIISLRDDLDSTEVTRSQLMCVVCYQNVKSTLLIPCRHLHTCNGCARTLCQQNLGCPVCRSPIQLVILVHDFY